MPKRAVSTQTRVAATAITIAVLGAVSLIPSAQAASVGRTSHSGPVAEGSALSVPPKFVKFVNKGSKKELQKALEDKYYKACKKSQEVKWSIGILAIVTSGIERFGPQKFDWNQTKVTNCAVFELQFESRISHSGTIGPSSGTATFDVLGKTRVKVKPGGVVEELGPGTLQVIEWTASGGVTTGDPAVDCTYTQGSFDDGVFRVFSGAVFLDPSSPRYGEINSLTIDPGTPKFYDNGGCNEGTPQEYDQDWRYFWGLDHSAEERPADECGDAPARECGPWQLDDSGLSPWTGPEGVMLARREYSLGEFFHFGSWTEVTNITLFRTAP